MAGAPGHEFRDLLELVGVPKERLGTNARFMAAPCHPYRLLTLKFSGYTPGLQYSEREVAALSHVRTSLPRQDDVAFNRGVTSVKQRPRVFAMKLAAAALTAMRPAVPTLKAS
jgi:hypothetical protein